jgi:hypothetical protein
MKLRKITGWLLMVLFSGMVLSCDLSSDLDDELSHDCIVTSMTMGSLKRIMHTNNSQGQDSTYEVTVVGSYFPLTIDHLGGKIYNNDSLPYGTDLSRVVFSAINAKGGMVIRSLATGKDTTFVATDSTDFTQPRTLVVYAVDGKSSRTYEVKLNVHKEEGDSAVWHKISAGNNSIGEMSETRALCYGGGMKVFGQVDGATRMVNIPLQGTSVAPQPEWLMSATNVVLQPRSVQSYNDRLYALSAQGTLVTSADGVSWETVNTDFTPQALVTAGKSGLVALAPTAFYISVDGIEWREMSADAPEKLPVTNVVGTCVPSTKNSAQETYVVVGQLGTENVIWRKWMDTLDGENYPWVNIQPSVNNAYPFPSLKDYTLATYDGITYVMGMRTDGTMSAIYASPDNGRSWKPGAMRLPVDRMLSQGKGCTGVTIAVDGENFLWVISSGDGQVWRGRYQRLGWK